MRKELVEIYSDSINAAVLRHPERKYPGILVQGDTLYSLAQSLRNIQTEGLDLDGDAAHELTNVTEWVEGLLAHYKSVLREHNMDLPFHEPPAA